MGRRSKRRRWDWEFTPAENRRRAKAKANYKSMTARPFGETTMYQPTHNMSMPPARFFFVYLLWREEEVPERLQTHVAMGFDRSSLETTRRLVQSGTQVSQLLYLGPVCDLQPHHHRLLRDLASTSAEVIIPQEEVESFGAAVEAAVVPER